MFRTAIIKCLCVPAFLAASCSPHLYPVCDTRLDLDTQTEQSRVIMPDTNLNFTYASPLRDYPTLLLGRHFLYPTTHRNPQQQSLQIPRGPFRTIIRGAGVSPKDSLLFLSSFAVAFLTDKVPAAARRHTADTEQVFETKSAPASLSTELLHVEIGAENLPVGRIVTRRGDRIFCRYYIPYREHTLCVCYVLRRADRHTVVPHAFSIAVIPSGNRLYLLKFYVNNALPDARPNRQK